MNEFEGKPRKLKPWGPGASEKSEGEKAKRKAVILSNLKAVVAEEKAKNPSFTITPQFIKQVAETRRDLFPTLRTYTSIMNYFSNDIDFLREQLDSPTD